MTGLPTSACGEPRCVASLLGRLESAAQSLKAGVSLGPYALDALLEDVCLCPPLAERHGLCQDPPRQVELSGKEARNAAALLRACPVSDRTWAVERLAAAISEAHRQLAVRMADAEARHDPDALVGPRCTGCNFL